MIEGPDASSAGQTAGDYKKQKDANMEQLDMTELDYIERIATIGPDLGVETSLEAFALLEEAIGVYPNSTSLWCLRGDVIQMGGEDSPYTLEDALQSYEHAASLDPKCSEAHEEIGDYWDLMGGSDLPKAEDAFRKAIALGCGPGGYLGLARVLAQRGHPKEGIRLLGETCPFKDDDQIITMRDEIETGQWSV